MDSIGSIRGEKGGVLMTNEHISGMVRALEQPSSGSWKWTRLLISGLTMIVKFPRC